jgi:DNA-binding GntR family transcriptional regulator
VSAFTFTEIGLQRQTLSAQIYANLEGRVLSGDLLPGTKLSEEGLAETFGVSRAPVREALVLLQRAGLAERFGQRDRIVAVPTAAFITQKYDVWWIIDVGRAYLSSLEATPADCESLRALIEEMDLAVRQDDLPKYQRVCGQFHDQIREGCKNADVNELGAGCDIHLRWFEALYDRTPCVSAAAVREHRDILAAFCVRDYARLADSIRVHMLRQRDDMLRLFQRGAVAAPMVNA